MASSIAFGGPGWGLEVRLRVSLEAEGGLLQVPIQYNHLLQGLIYNNLDRALLSWLHEEGHAYGMRRFKLFAFSRLFGKREVTNGHVYFNGPSPATGGPDMYWSMPPEEVTSVEFVRVEYDVERAAKGILHSTLPDEFADQLKAGEPRSR